MTISPALAPAQSPQSEEACSGRGPAFQAAAELSLDWPERVEEILHPLPIVPWQNGVLR